MNSGKLDIEEAAPAVAWLGCYGHVSNPMEALWRVNGDTLAFLARRWDSIERAGAGLLKDGGLTARQVRALTQI